MFKTVFYCGHESRFGVAHLAPLLCSKTFKVEKLVLASFQRWSKFGAQLTGESARTGWWAQARFARRLQKFKAAALRLNPACKISLCDNINTEALDDGASRIDVLLCAGYPQIFGEALIGRKGTLTLNFHPSLLPRCRGAHPIYWAIATGEKAAGVSCHVMTAEIDSGPLVAQRSIHFDSERILYSELYDLVVKETPNLIADVERALNEGHTFLAQQGEATTFKNDRGIHRKLWFGLDDLAQISAKIRAGGAFAFDRFGRKVVFSPPVVLLNSVSQVTNHFDARIPDGAVVHASKESAIIRTSGRYLQSQYSFDNWCAPLPLAFRASVNRLTALFQKPLRVGEVLQ